MVPPLIPDPIADAASLAQLAQLIQERLDRRAGRKPDELTKTKRRDIIKALELAYSPPELRTLQTPSTTVVTNPPMPEIAHACERDIAVFWTLTGDAPYPYRKEFKRLGNFDPYSFVPGYAVADAIDGKVGRWKLHRWRPGGHAIRIDAEGALLNLLLRLHLRDDELSKMNPALREIVEHPKHHMRDPEEGKKVWLAALDADKKDEKGLLEMHVYMTRTEGRLQEAIGRWITGKIGFKRSAPTLSYQVAQFRALTGRWPEWDHPNKSPRWNRGQMLDFINRLERARGIKVDTVEAVRVSERILNMPQVALSAEEQSEMHKLDNVVAGSPDWRQVRWITPYKNERNALNEWSALGERASVEDYAYYPWHLYKKAVLPNVDSVNDPGSNIETFLDGRDKEGWLYVFVKDAQQLDNPDAKGRIIKRRGKIYDEVPVTELGGDAQKIWDDRKAAAPDLIANIEKLGNGTQVDPMLERVVKSLFTGTKISPEYEDVHGVLDRATRLSEEDLHDFWALFGHNPPAYIKPFAELPEDVVSKYRDQPMEVERRTGVDRRQTNTGNPTRGEADRRQPVDKEGLEAPAA